MYFVALSVAAATSASALVTGTGSVRGCCGATVVAPLKTGKSDHAFEPLPPSVVRPEISMQEAFAPTHLNGRLIAGIVMANVAIVGSGLSMGYVAGVDVFTGNMQPDALCAAATAAFMLGSVGLCVAKDVPAITDAFTDTQVFALNIIGRSTRTTHAAFTAAAIGIGAGVSEELLFRGFIFQFAEHNLGLPAPCPLVLSALLFWFAHFPTMGLASAFDGLLGGALATSYAASGHNLLVPMAAHSVYDACLVFVAWRTASGDLRRRVQAAVAEHAEGRPGVPDTLFRRLSRDGRSLRLDDLLAVDHASPDTLDIVAQLKSKLALAAADNNGTAKDAVSIEEFHAFFLDDPVAARFPWLVRAALLMGEDVGA